MFQLREPHLQAFQKVAYSNFEERAIAHFRKCFPSKTRELSDDDLRNRLHAAQTRAHRYGLASEKQIIQFVDTGFLSGENFDSDPQLSWPGEVLNDPAKSADERAARLYQRAIKESKQGARP